jgi:hypothetical protein
MHADHCRYGSAQPRGVAQAFYGTVAIGGTTALLTMVSGRLSLHGLGPTWLRCAVRRFPSSGVFGRQFATALDKLLRRIQTGRDEAPGPLQNVVHVQFICTVVLSRKCSIT